MEINKRLLKSCEVLMRIKALTGFEFYHCVAFPLFSHFVFIIFPIVTDEDASAIALAKEDIIFEAWDETCHVNDSLW